jgi:septal ring factor EnvC (AmiA/AmiB activator)
LLRKKLKENEKEIKRMRAKLKKIKQHKLWLNDEIENNKTLTKELRKKIINQKNKDRIGENNIWQIVI